MIEFAAVNRFNGDTANALCNAPFFIAMVERRPRAAFSVLQAPCSLAQTAAPPEDVGTVRVDATPGHAINSFDPDSALGQFGRCVVPPRHRHGLLAAHYSGVASRRAGARSRTAITPSCGWPHGTGRRTAPGATPRTASGYFTGSTELKEPTRYILAYALPHRGFATSGDRPVQGPNLTYWKSNPYLTSKFTGESDALHPQWVIVDLKAAKAVNAVRIQWASPYATKYQVEYWDGTGDALDFDGGPKGEWKIFRLRRCE